MTPSFSVRTSSRLDRLAKPINLRQPDFPSRYDRAREILGTDPYKRTRSHHIKKLEGARQGDGQYRLSLGRFRFRYDLYGREVVLQYCGLRREETYR